MKRVHGCVPLALLLVLSVLAPALCAARPTADDPAAESAAPSIRARAQQLAADVRAFASEPGVSRAKREKRIATAVRVAVVAATAYRIDSEQIVGAASELAAAAAHAAPAYTDVIVNAAVFAPAVSHIPGASAQVRVAALAGARGGHGTAVAHTSGSGHPSKTTARHPAPVEPEAPSESELPDTEAPAPRTSRPSPEMARALADSGAPDQNIPREHGHTGDQQFRVSLTADVGVRHDDNIFLTNTNEVADTIISVTPGIGLQWGQNSLSHGHLAYREAFNHYQQDTSPNVSLGSGEADFGYSGDTGFDVTLTASYQQLYQTNTDVLAAGATGLFHTDIFSGNGGVEIPIGVKTGMRAGIGYNKTQYEVDSLTGNSDVSLPLSFFYKITPKTDVSLGYTYSSQKPDKPGPDSKDQYLNVGAHGEFTPKLTGSFSVGYETRRVTGSPKLDIFAFNGAFAYAITPKTNATLNLSRSFNVGALGSNTTDTVYQLGVTSDLSPQWQLSASLSYLNSNYGDAIFRENPLATPVNRTDHTWEGSLVATYIYTQWLTTSASYSLHNNNSTISSVDFTDNVFSLSVGLRY
jgi:polysaccharide biosynthesis protein VpsM